MTSTSPITPGCNERHVRRALPAICAGLLCTVAQHSAAQSARVQPGLWEITMRSEFAGSKQALPPTVIRHCLTADQTPDPRQLLPRAVSGTECRVRDYTLQGTHATWNIVCAGDPIIRGGGSLDIGTRSYSGINRLEMRRGEDIMILTHIYEAQHVGPCGSSTAR